MNHGVRRDLFVQITQALDTSRQNLNWIGALLARAQPYAPTRWLRCVYDLS